MLLSLQSEKFRERLFGSVYSKLLVLIPFFIGFNFFPIALTNAGLHGFLANRKYPGQP